MNADSLAILVAVLIAVVLLVIYFVVSYRERGRSPHYSKEVYLYYDPVTPTPDPASVAAKYHADVAAPAQVAIYAASGGGAHGYGAVSSGAYVGLTPTGGGELAATAFPGQTPAVYGVWLYGPKPRRGTKGVTPFSCAHWFQPEGRATRPG